MINRDMYENETETNRYSLDKVTKVSPRCHLPAYEGGLWKYDIQGGK